jgi:hypothetical protein
MPFGLAFVAAARFLAAANTGVRTKPFPAYAAWSFFTFSPLGHHCFSWLMEEKTMTHYLKNLFKRCN